MAHNALIFYAYFHLKQHNVHEQALLCRGWMSTSLLSHQFPLPETLNRQHLFFCVSWHFTAGFLSARSLARSQPSHLVRLSLCRQPFSPSLFPFYSLLSSLSPFCLCSSIYQISSLLLPVRTLHLLFLPFSTLHFLYPHFDYYLGPILDFSLFHVEANTLFSPYTCLSLTLSHLPPLLVTHHPPLPLPLALPRPPCLFYSITQVSLSFQTSSFGEASQ